MSMPRLICALVVSCLSLAPAWAAGERRPLLRQAAAEEAYSARVIVKYKAESTLMRAQSAGASATVRPQHAAAMGARLGLALADGWELGARTQVLHGRGIGSADLAKRLAAQPDVEWAEVDGRKTAAAVVPNDTFYASGSRPFPLVGQWYLRAPDSTFVAATNAVGAWATSTGSAAVTVAVLDTGIRPEHPDFKRADGTSKLYAGFDFASDTGTGPYNTADGTDPGDFTTASDSCGAGSSSWHGTQTAGIIGAATDNSTGIASVGREVMIQPVRVLGKCGGWDSDIQIAMRWAAGVSSTPSVNPHPAKVLNMSLGSDGACSAAYQDIFNELYAAGVSVVVAAGNGVDTPTASGGIAVGTPANCPHAIAVGGLRHAGSKVGYSNLGPEVVVSAPAGNCVNTSGDCLYPIMTTTNAGSTTATTSTYTDMVNDPSLGTSFSAPIVTGTVALMLSVNPTLTPTQVISALKSGARAFTTTGGAAGTAQCVAPSTTPQGECYCTTSTCGAGMLDVGRSVALITPDRTTAPRAVISASSATPGVGDTVTLSSNGSGSYGGRSLVGYAWTITDGSGFATFSGSTSTASATLTAKAVGVVTVQLALADSDGVTTTQTTTITVQAAATGGGSGGGGSSSGGGGGAFAPAWLALLALGVLALRRRT